MPVTLAVALALAAGAGCNDDGPPAAPRDAGSADAWPGTCDPVRQDCPQGQQCVGGCDVTGVMAKVFTCALPASDARATHGQACATGCAPGHDCFTVTSTDGGTRTLCRKYCNQDSDCSTTRCAPEGLVCTAADPAPIGRVCAL